MFDQTVDRDDLTRLHQQQIARTDLLRAAARSTRSSTYRCTIRGARSSNRRNSRRARAAARASSVRPLASITAITAPAKYSCTTNVPTSASTAISIDTQPDAVGPRRSPTKSRAPTPTPS